MKAIKGFLKKYWITFFVIAVFLGVYAYLTQNKMIDTYIFSNLPSIAKAFKQFWKMMLMNVAQSFNLLIPSLTLGTVIALAAGIIMGMNTRIREVSHPIVYAISVIPALLLSPIALYVAPSFRAASRFLIVWATIWPTLFSTITGVRTIDKRYLDNAATLEVKGLRKMTGIILPAAMPSILSGFITALRSSFLVLVFAEMYGCDYGMGYFIQKNSIFGIYPNVWAGMIVMVIVLVIVMKVFEFIQYKLLKWTMD